MGLQRTPMYASLTRPRLFGGCERKPVAVLVFGAIALPFLLTPQGFNFDLLYLTAFLAVSGIAVLRRVNKQDPQWVSIYYRSLRYRQELYAAKAHPRAYRAHRWSAF